jgi:MFS family permease
MIDGARGLAPLAHRDVRAFVVSRFFGGVALTLLRATISWQVWALSGSAFQLGLVGLFQFAPTLALTLVGGAVADSYDRRRVAMLAQAAGMLGSALLFALTLRGDVALWIVYAVVAANSAASAFESPSGAALLPGLVPRQEFPAAVALVSSVRNSAWMLGPVVMGFVVDAAGIAWAYALHAALVAASAGLLVRLRPRPIPVEPRGVTLAAIREGIAFVRSRAEVLGAMSVDMFAVIFGAAGALLPIYAEQILQVGPRGYGLLSASFEIGTVVMSILLVALPPIRNAGRALLLAVAVYGAATCVFGLSRSFVLSLLAFVAAGMADQVSVVARGTLIQLATPDALRGRVSAVNFVFIGASNQLGAVEAGFLAALTSPTFAVVSGGLLALAIAALVAWRVPELRDHRLSH